MNNPNDIPNELLQFDAVPESFDAPDPEDATITNRDRATFAAAGVAAYGRAKNMIQENRLVEDVATCVQDLLTDLRHFCDGHGVDYLWVEERAMRMYKMEVDTPVTEEDET